MRAANDTSPLFLEGIAEFTGAGNEHCVLFCRTALLLQPDNQNIVGRISLWKIVKKAFVGRKWYSFAEQLPLIADFASAYAEVNAEQSQIVSRLHTVSERNPQFATLHKMCINHCKRERLLFFRWRKLSRGLSPAIWNAPRRPVSRCWWWLWILWIFWILWILWILWI